MAEAVRLPKLGANVTEGTVGLWHAAEGDAVRAGDALAEIITSKATFDIEAPADGLLLKICAPERSNIPVGYVLGIVGASGEALPDVAAENDALMARFRQAALAAGAEDEPSRATVRATPGARRLAKAEGVDLGDVPPADGKSVVREEDVRRFLDVTRRR